ncbi:MAG: HD domain-containing protein [Anaerolineae bacterium]|nr:MAG: HD domain-containing protein [Anaerolineae bacterium]
MPTIEQASCWYPENDPVHGFDHVLRVMRTAEEIGAELGADLDILRAAALLHDAAGADPRKDRAQHENSSAEFARQVLQDEGWPSDRVRAVAHCIASHRYRGNQLPKSLEAKILFDADKLDVVGAFGVARTIGYAIQADQPIFSEPSEKFLESGESEPGEPHSAYHEYLFKLRNVKDRLYTESARRLAGEREKVLISFFEQLAVEARGRA